MTPLLLLRHVSVSQLDPWSSSWKSNVPQLQDYAGFISYCEEYRSDDRPKPWLQRAIYRVTAGTLLRGIENWRVTNINTNKPNRS